MAASVSSNSMAASRVLSIVVWISPLAACTSEPSPYVVDDETARASNIAVLEAQRTGGSVFAQFSNGISAYSATGCVPLADANDFVEGGDEDPPCGSWSSSRLIPYGEASKLWYPETLGENDVAVPWLVREPAPPLNTPVVLVAEFIDLPMGTTCSESTRYLVSGAYFGGEATVLSAPEASQILDGEGVLGEVEVRSPSHLFQGCQGE